MRNAIRDIFVEWRTPFSSELWAQLQKIGTSPVSPQLRELAERLRAADEQSQTLAERLLALSERISPEVLSIGPLLPYGGRVAQVGIRRAVDAESLDWTLILRDAPDSPPPEDVRTLDETIGGRSGLLALLRTGWQSETAPEARYRIRLLLERLFWICPALPQDEIPHTDSDAGVNVLARVVRREEVEYRLEDSEHGIEWINLRYLSAKRYFAVDVRAREQLVLSDPHWLPYVEFISERVIGAFFQRREVQYATP